MSIYNKKPSAIQQKFQTAQKKKALKDLPLEESAIEPESFEYQTSPKETINSKTLPQLPVQFVSEEEVKAVFGGTRDYTDSFNCAENTLHFALRQKKFGVFQSIFERGNNFSASHIIQATGQSLCQAAHGWQSFDILLYLLRKKPEVNYQTDKHMPLLVSALKSQDLKFVQLLIENKVDPNLITHEGLSALHYIKKNLFASQDETNALQIVELLFDSGFKEELLCLQGQSVFKQIIKEQLDLVPEYLVEKIQNVHLLQQFHKDMQEVLLQSSQASLRYTELQNALNDKIKILSEKNLLSTSIEPALSQNIKSSLSYKI